MHSTLTNIAKTLRKNQTDVERKLWHHLRAREFERGKFRRQQPIGRFIVDFVCFEKKIIVELDGGQHSEERDKQRDQCLKGQGFRILRFWDNSILENIDGVLEEIRKQL